MNADFSIMTMPDLKKLLSVMPRTADVDLEFAGRIVKNDQEAVDYFIGDFSHPILDYIYANVLWLKSDPDVYQELSGDYYLFIAAPFSPLAGWSKIKAYKGKNNAKLYSYVSKMASNYFRRKRSEYGKYDKNQMKLLEYVDYQTLLTYDYSDSDDSSEKTTSERLVMEAFSQLSDTDKRILDCLCVRKTHWTKAFEELRIYMDPSGPAGLWKDWSIEEKQSAIDREWKPVQKQFAIAGLKKRAVLHLTRRYCKLMGKEYE